MKENNFTNKLIAAVLLIAAIWAIYFVDWIIPYDFERLGILPRHISGLKGILFSPFIHGDWLHLISNTAPLFFLTLTILVFYPRMALPVWLLSAVLGGGLVWLIGRTSYHIGASGIIYALAGFLIASGLFRRDFKSLAIAIIIFFLYGGILWGVFPTVPWVSWEAHLSGFVIGVLLAYLFRHGAREEKKAPTDIT